MSSLLDKGFQALFRALRRGLIVPAVLVLGALPALALEPVSFDEPPDTPAFEVKRDGKSIPVTLRQLEKLAFTGSSRPAPTKRASLPSKAFSSATC